MKKSLKIDWQTELLTLFFEREGKSWALQEQASADEAEKVSLGQVQIQPVSDHELIIRDEDGKQSRVFYSRQANRVYVVIDGQDFVLERPDPAAQDFGASGGDAASEIRSPMTGKVVLLPKVLGDACEEGETIVVVEAMKMEHQLKAPFGGSVGSLHCEVGQLVDMGDVLAQIVRPESKDC